MSTHIEHHAGDSRPSAAATAAPTGKKKRPFPHTLTILVIVTALVWFAALFIPAGQYQLDEDGRPVAGSFQQIESPLTFPERVGDLLLAPMAGLGLASVGFNSYLRFVLPLMGIWLVIQLTVFVVAAF